jgi:branched-chain amino acid transport system permease protein
MQELVSGLTVGGVYVLLALGFTLALGMGDLVNLAHGAFVVAGMYVVYEGVVEHNLNQYLAVALAPVFVGGGSYVVYRLVMERARRGGHRDQIIYSLLVLGALGVVYQLFYGEKGLVALPGGSSTVSFAGATVSSARLVAFVVALIVTALLAYVASRTTVGRLVRATASYESGARAIGVPVDRVFAGVFVASGATAGLAGGLMMTFLPVDPTLGLDFLLIALIVSIAGRLTFVGCVVIGLLYGVATTSLTAHFSNAVATLSIFIAFLLVLAGGEALAFRGRRSLRAG